MAYCSLYTLAGISTDCQGNVGGIKKVYIANYQDDIYTIDDDPASTGSTVGVVTALKSGVTWYEYNFRPESSNFTSTLNKTSDGGNYVSTEIVLNFARMETSKRLEMNALALNEIAVIVVDSNGKRWCFGRNLPVSSSTGSAESGTAMSDANRYSITLVANDSNFAPELASDVVING